MTTPATKIIAPTSIAISTIAAPSPVQDFFQRVYTHLKEGQLKSAQDLLNQVDETIHGQLPKNNKTICDFVSKDGLSNDQRAGNLIKILRKSKLFPEVCHDDFEKNRMQALLSFAMAKASAPKIVKTNAQILEDVRASGLKAGMTKDQVDNAFEEIELDDGSKVWMVKTGHDDIFNTWENSLVTLAAKEEIVLFCEGTRRMEEYEHITCKGLGFMNRGFFRGLETEESLFKMKLFLSYQSLISSFAMKADLLSIYLPISNVINLIATSHNTLFSRRCAEKAATTSKLAGFIIKTYEAKVGKQTSLKELGLINQSIMHSYPQLNEWFDFVSELLVNAYSNDPQDVQKATNEWIASGRQYFAERRLEKLFACNTAAEMVITALRGPRDIGYAEIFLEERPKTPKEKPALVVFRRNNGPGFKKALLEQHRRLEKKKPFDSKINESDKPALASSKSGIAENTSTEEKKKKRRH